MKLLVIVTDERALRTSIAIFYGIEGVICLAGLAPVCMRVVLMPLILQPKYGDRDN